MSIGITTLVRPDLDDVESLDHNTRTTAHAFYVITYFIVSYLLAEILLRVAAAATLKIYFTNVWNSIEFVVVVVSFALVVSENRFPVSLLRVRFIFFQE